MKRKNKRVKHLWEIKHSYKKQKLRVLDKKEFVYVDYRLVKKGKSIGIYQVNYNEENGKPNGMVSVPERCEVFGHGDFANKESLIKLLKAYKTAFKKPVLFYPFEEGGEEII